MRVLYILCGGRGKRLGAITKKVPKPLIKINGKPFLTYLIDFYSEYFEKIVLLAGYRGEEFLKLRNSKVDAFIENEPLGTGGALVRMRKRLPERFFLCNGDTFLYPFKPEKFISFCERKTTTTLMLCEEEKRARGAVIVNEGKVVEFLEKQGEGNGHVYTGFCFLNKRDLEGWKNGGLSLEKQVFPKLAGGGKLLSYVEGAKIYDIGTQKGIRKFKNLTTTNQARHLS